MIPFLSGVEREPRAPLPPLRRALRLLTTALARLRGAPPIPAGAVIHYEKID